MNKKAKISIILTTASLIILGIFEYGPTNTCHDQVSFNKTSWDQGLKSDEGGERFSIANNLYNCDLLIGMSEESLTQMLGKPDRALSDTEINYWLGPNHSSYFRIDMDWLSVWIKDDQVIRVAIRSD